jgi:CRP-like cAMP-binding protein
MRSARMKAGRVLFRKGDAARHLYFLASGQIEFVEIGEMMEAGRLFGEIAFFAPDKRRTLTARCATDCTVLRIDETTFKQLYFQNPAFGFQVVNLVTSRLIADRHRLESMMASSRPAPLGS